ncbi:Nif11-like leader peptide family natural product precursor [Anabaena cylindrica FACHB-243]|uniref:Bacteriocin propeptide, TIGR03798 family n=1 Tax=Anabaena cylindrica (strain ATCC 27899 / PCC 7122) TaxID=272123 RepID=K9ZJQ4_ANACC|nr:MULTISPECIES: Nif11-like leader peptide family natural product precursor [Anabaena]AFZ59473.1 bacteriocin propeptide, TIGR03798 family [Anabaena cylindrica PCC 7122]MBD2417628.1 Nif11-like leader peptide family natural product precursor [Anabaena cylindrica FACHB-243]MBY5283254.1 Nif11-like leader peptide family natural product precursor [Anabaena sp. CCAP 1446/1C]MBY5310628.1 Nif11-like leader peptide family natural product precursor [Anabaena sp. CCAP 1446/1C]MCM2405389.1 Nif11-like leade
MSLENVKAFYKQLASDEDFRTQIEGVENKEECSQIVKAAGYDFTQAEYEEYTYQLLESANSEGEVQDLGEKELAAVFGGIIGRPKIQPLYGVVWPPFQLLYGVIRPDDTLA